MPREKYSPKNIFPDKHSPQKNLKFKNLDQKELDQKKLGQKNLGQKYSAQKYSMTWKIRKIFKLLAETSDQYLQPLGVTVQERAVLEFLSNWGEVTVPELARLFNVSRQNIQVRMNGLAGKNLIEQKTNPSHKSSVLWVLTSEGKELFVKVSEIERVLMGGTEEGIFSGISEEEVLSVNKVLNKFTKNLTRKLDQGS